jgi:hypothetical protein
MKKRSEHFFILEALKQVDAAQTDLDNEKDPKKVVEKKYKLEVLKHLSYYISLLVENKKGQGTLLAAMTDISKGYVSVLPCEYIKVSSNVDPLSFVGKYTWVNDGEVLFWTENESSAAVSDFIRATLEKYPDYDYYMSSITEFEEESKRKGKSC